MRELLKRSSLATEPVCAAILSATRCCSLRPEEARFAASPLVKSDEIARITGEAVEVAKANASLKNKPVVLVPVPAYRDYWQTPHERDPFATSIEEKLHLIRSAAAEAKKSQQVFAAGCTLAFRSEDKYFASSVGSSIHQLNLQTYGVVNATVNRILTEMSGGAFYADALERAQAAAGTVHSDIERGFIRAEVASYDDLVAVEGSFADLRARGQQRLEGKDYIVRDGEICHFRFNVAK